MFAGRTPAGGRAQAGPAGRTTRSRRVLATLLALALLLGELALGWWVSAWPVAQVSHLGGPTAGGGAWLHTERGRIMDSEGRAVQLRGFNDDALVDERNVEVGRPAPLDERDAQLMSRSGFDVVRLPIAWSRLEPRRGHVDADYLRQIEDAVRLLERHRLRVVLDMHFGVAWGPASEVPAWARVPLVPDWRPIAARPWRYGVDPQTVAALAHFWTSDDWQRDLARAWRAVASRFRQDPMLVGYDLYNEPRPLPLPPGTFENRFLWPFSARLISRIGEVDPNHLFIVEATLFDTVPTATEPLVARGVVYSPHLYVDSLIEWPFVSRPAAMGAAVQERRREAAALGAPLWVGEMGVNARSPAAAGYTRDALAALDGGATSGWAWWQWRQDGGWGIRSADGSRLDLTVLRRLAQPYLRAAPAGVAATVTSGGSGLEVRASRAGPAGTAVVAWPQLLLGVPRVSGPCAGASAWDAGSSALTVTLKAGQGCRIAPVTPMVEGP